MVFAFVPVSIVGVVVTVAVIISVVVVVTIPVVTTVFVVVFVFVMNDPPTYQCRHQHEHDDSNR